MHELPMSLVERSITALDELLTGWHVRTCDLGREGSCWCCCITCTELEQTETLRGMYWDMVRHREVREGTCASDSPAPGTDAPSYSTNVSGPNSNI